MPAVVQRHLLLCATPSKPRCCDPAVGQASWNQLKQRIRELGLDVGSQAPVLRSKVDCLRVCMAGPVLLVWPDGICYGRVTPAAVDRIVDQHLLAGQPVEDLVIGRTGWRP
ncbi:MAG: (2Fe-2S) ferredoxin domain-containing protein [Aphanocapsa feldmannii 277cV]|uniref:(2Fe-2S) ferredoxin domain-containing protein n=2 Tax=Aphanocapsa feldmannii TaxID=192050 RepID=A0A524RLV3_9CHRO|nr:MAG: (2Fe-2S) ferredoxin domain-containing protein [Aphanocapsa feldmannii 288cV]TGG91045.1 MAG: (2Fe-2S) ferredoxin domain-containing protein [Aphanocapsa feldmannii 277cV]TGH19835.1 MAG: (2Fe-2S) ferredoxin domain-containing protein [Aphanocapsa feldmannii 277cI]